MCGLTGILALDATPRADELGAAVSQMAAALTHRGPDGHAVWVDPDSRLALGHTRLAILDLSPAGAQPMTSRSGVWTVAFNGEIYNAGVVRSRLTSIGSTFRGHSDTEVLVEALAAWGLDRTLAIIEGMYAFAAWEASARTVHLARDPLGEKPLYHAEVDGSLLFGSELKALARHPRFRPSIDPDGVAQLLRRSFIPAPGTIYRDVRKLPAGAVLSVEAGSRVVPAPRQHYRYADVVRAATADRWDPSEQELVDHLDQALRASVADRQQSDVPLGAFLSGGIDSSLVVALQQAQSAQPVRTFTVDVGDEAGSEAAKAAAVARHLGTDHTTIELSEADALEVVPRLPDIYDEPFGDPSGIPTYLVSRETRRHVTVAMSGDGGDELFGGYNRYTLGAAAWPRLARIPRIVRRGGAGALSSVPPRTWDRAFAGLERVTGRELPPRPGDKVHRLAGILPAADPDDLYARAAWHWLDADAIAGAAPTTGGPEGTVDGLGVAERFMLRDGVSVLPDQMLAKVDRASMATSLEIRVPLLAPAIAELAWRLPPERKLAGGRGKLPLRAVLGRYLPTELIELPKQGFDPPLASWLRGPLRPWAEDLLSPSALRRAGLVDPEPIRRAWVEHRGGRGKHEPRVGSVLMLHAWAQR
jgi:asparagine synthase (glutamine-hydrolysing)